MKKNSLVLFLVIISLLILTACSAGPKDLTAGKTAEKVIEESFDKWYQLQSYDMDMTSKMKLSVKKEVMDMSMSGKITAFQKPLKMKMILDVNVPSLDQKMTVEQYMMEENQKIVIYQHIEDQWQKITVDDPAMIAMMSMDPRDNLKLFMDNLTKAEILGEEKIGEKNTVKINLVASSKIFEQIFQGTAGQNLGINQDIFRSDLLAKIGDLKYLLWVDKATLETVKCQMDLTENMQNFGHALTEDANLPDKDELKEVFSNMETSVEYFVLNQNKAQDFTLPEEAKNAKDIPLNSK